MSPFDPRIESIKGVCIGTSIDRSNEIVKQKEWCMMDDFRRRLGEPDAPVIVVKGNHDYIDLADWIGGDVFEFTVDPKRTTTLFGLKFGGIRGINYIRGVWDDELYQHQFDERAEALPDDIDVLVTHIPPYGVLDKFDEHWGSRSIARYVNRRAYTERPLKAHFFGHVHAVKSAKFGNTLFSNAATGFVVFDL